MKENGVIRRRLSGKEADPYIGLGRKILGEMKNIMQFSGIKQLSWTKDLQDGVRIVVSSIFGQDEVRIFVPVSNPSITEKVMQTLKIKSESLTVYMRYDSVDALGHWTETDGYVHEYQEAGVITPYAISGDGETIVGYYSGVGAVKWTAAGGIVDLGTVGGEAVAVNEDGSIVLANNGANAFRWTEATGAVSVMNNYRHFVAMSDDGSVIVGNDTSVTPNYHAFTWDQNKGATNIGTFEATGISADGSTIVGFVENDSTIDGVIWTVKGRETLTASGDSYMYMPLAASEDGSVVVGQYGFYDGDGFNQLRAFRWTKADGVKVLPALYIRPELHNSTDTKATDVSRDGTTIVGFGRGSNGLLVGYYTLMWTDAGDTLTKLSPDSSGGTNSSVALIAEEFSEREQSIEM